MAMVFLSLILVAALFMVGQSHQGAMDAGFEALAIQMALEPIEVFRGFGARRMADYAAHPLPEYPLGVQTVPVVSGAIHRPVDCGLFEREIILRPVSTPFPGVQVEVKVRPRGQTQAQRWFRREEWSLSCLLVEQPR